MALDNFFVKLVRPAGLLGAARLALRVALKGDRRRCATSSNPAFLCRGFDPVANRHRMALDNFL
jgi:hypothetical protein